jgi:DNA topoisomerase-1
MKFPGFTILYSEGKDDAGEENGQEKTLPDVKEGEKLKLLSLTPEQRFTEPPPRFSEATLVKELEEKGIGRPSTYATILSTIQDREYVRLDSGRFHPTDLGILVTELLVKNFPDILDVTFTAGMENELDLIEEGKLKRIESLEKFYSAFEKDLKQAKAQMRNVKKEEVPTDLVCEKCGSPMIIKWGRNGRFIACKNYPECRNTMNFSQDENGVISEVRSEDQTTDIVCPECGRKMAVKQGRFGSFLGCTGYPECRTTMPLSLGIKCPMEGCSGEITEKRTRKGKIFFGCSLYPRCKYAIWDKPVPEPCPECGAAFTLEKYDRKKGRYRACSNPDCTYKETKPGS